MVVKPNRTEFSWPDLAPSFVLQRRLSGILDGQSTPVQASVGNPCFLDHLVFADLEEESSVDYGYVVLYKIKVVVVNIFFLLLSLAESLQKT